ncbi:MAG: rhamnulose-1-phosphate aldolase [Coriobacteriia bacterium]|nr:rhamnulose-1-phosphate aldolase [Coriobacteriia bacterium]
MAASGSEGDMSIEQANCIRRFMRICSDGWQKGWHEANGGNLSYRMDGEDIAVCKPYLSVRTPWISVGVDAPGVGGELFIVTGAGKYMRKVEVDLSDNIGIVEMNAAGNAYRVVWGFDDSGRPTSEFETHLLIHEMCSKLSDGDDRVVYHAHTPNITALTTAFVLDSRVLSRVLWKSTTECIIAAPEGVGLLPFTQPASNELAEKTAALMEDFRAVVWSGHGVIACSQTFDDTFGLIDTLEKAAYIYIMARAMRGGEEAANLLSDDNLRTICASYELEPNEDFLS